jgi:hypothetical protein
MQFMRQGRPDILNQKRHHQQRVTDGGHRYIDLIATIKPKQKERNCEEQTNTGIEQRDKKLSRHFCFLVKGSA